MKKNRFLKMYLFITMLLTISSVGFSANMSLAILPTTCEYFYVNSSNTATMTFSNPSREIYIIKFSTPSSWVNFTGTTILTGGLTNYFLLPATDTNNAFEHIDIIESQKMSIYSEQTPGVNPNIRVYIKSK